MVFKKLSPTQLTELWNRIERKAGELRNVAMSHNTVKVYRIMDDLDFLRRRLQSHHGAVALEETLHKKDGDA